VVGSQGRDHIETGGRMLATAQHASIEIEIHHPLISTPKSDTPNKATSGLVSRNSGYSVLTLAMANAMRVVAHLRLSDLLFFEL
jgi:hypothetical protein